jgi:predicted nucleic acid-binding protein
MVGGLAMAFKVVLDADVLFPASLRDTLLRLAELELFDPLWSDRILEEMKRNLIEDRGFTSGQAKGLAGAMNDAFEDAVVPADEIDGLEPVMTNREKDRHVLAAAIARDAGVIVTNNVKHFPPEACNPHGVDISDADEFLCSLFDLDPALVCVSMKRQASELRNPPHTLDEVLSYLAAGGASEFAERVRGQLNI